MSIIISVPVVAPNTDLAASAFMVAHGLAQVPSFLPVIVPTSSGRIFWQSPNIDGTYFYLGATGAGITAIIEVMPQAPLPCTPQVDIIPKVVYMVTAPAVSPFIVAHGLGHSPVTLPIINMIDQGDIWWSSPYTDSIYFYMTAAGIGMRAQVLMYE